MASSNETEEGSGQDFDLSAAGLRADGGDLRISVEVLARQARGRPPRDDAGAAPWRGPARARAQAGERAAGSSWATPASSWPSGTSAGVLPPEGGRRDLDQARALDPGAWVGALTEELRSRGASAARGARERSRGCWAEAVPETPEIDEREQAVSLARIEKGELPLAAERRLKGLRDGAGRASPLTSPWRSSRSATNWASSRSAR